MAAFLLGVLAAAASGQETTTTTEPGAPAEAAVTESVRGTLTQAGEAVPGVGFEVADGDGNVVGRTTSAADGSWEVPVPGPGRYEVRLVEDTLPQGITLTRAGDDTRDVVVRSGQRQVLLFPLGAGAGGGPSFAERAAQAALNGVKFGLIIAMTAIGLSLIFGTTGLINFAHGELVTVGAIMAWYLNARGPQLHLLLAGLIAIVLAGGVGAALHLGLWRPLGRRRVGLFQLLVISIGLSLAARHVLLIFFGGRRQSYTDFTIQRQLEFGPWSITPRDLTVVLLSIAALVAVAAVLQRSRIGKAIRAVADNVGLAESSGIDVHRVVLLVWVAGAALAATGGVFLGTVVAVDWLMGFNLLLPIFAAVILGGLGTAYGALVGSLAVGLVTEMSTLWFAAELKAAWALGVLIVVLLVRPQGILGVRQRVG